MIFTLLPIVFKVVEVLQLMVGCHIGEEQLIGIADRTLQEADNDNDREITFDEFCKVLETSDIAQTLSIKFKD